MKWEARKLGAVLLATLGVLAVVYGGSTASSSEKPEVSSSQASVSPSSPMVGDVLTLLGSIGYAGYQVFYKRYAALASDPELETEGDYEHVPASDDPEAENVLLRESPDPSMVYPPPFGLHSNFWTSAIGLCTLVVLWIPIPILHWLDVEPFALPNQWKTIGAISGIMLSGAIFNAGFMVCDELRFQIEPFSQVLIDR